MPPSADDGSVVRRGYVPSEVWGLDLEGAVTGRTWWWWFWLFFLRRDPSDPRPRQVMIMHTTRLASHLRVQGVDWRPTHAPVAEPPENGGDTPTRARFSGLAAGWYFDGSQMRHPLLLQSQEYTLAFGPGPEGSLVPSGRSDLEMRGDGARYLVAVADNDGKTRMNFEVTPWAKELSAHERASARFLSDWNYSILRVPGMRARGEIHGPGGSAELVEGTAYFQRVRVNSPTVPWYWGIVHADPGLYVDYFQANLGADLLRSSPTPRPRLDSSRLANFGRRTTLEVIDAPAGSVREFRSFRVRPRAREGAESPDFMVEGEEQGASVRFALRPYARACWTVEQRGRRLPLWRRLQYNELPSEVTEFQYHDKKSGRRLDLGDLSQVSSVCEHAWGALP